MCRPRVRNYEFGKYVQSGTSKKFERYRSEYTVPSEITYRSIILLRVRLLVSWRRWPTAICRALVSKVVAIEAAHPHPFSGKSIHPHRALQPPFEGSYARISLPQARLGVVTVNCRLSTMGEMGKRGRLSMVCEPWRNCQTARSANSIPSHSG